MSDERQRRWVGVWTLILCLVSAATGVGFAVSVRLGVVLACVTFAVLVCLVAAAARHGRRRRAAGDRTDLSALRERMRRQARWQLVSAGLVILACGVGLATKDARTPTWIFIVMPTLVLAGLGWLWLVVNRFLPWAQRRQQARSDDGAPRSAPHGGAP